MQTEAGVMLIRVTTPSGADGFFKFVPPHGTAEMTDDVVMFRAVDQHGRGPTISARRTGTHQAETVFSSVEVLMSFSDYVVRAGGKMTAAYQQTEYRAALDEWKLGLL